MSPDLSPGFWHFCRARLVPAGFWQGLVHPGPTTPQDRCWGLLQGRGHNSPLGAMRPSCWILGLLFAQLAKFEAMNQKTHPVKICSSVQSRSMCCRFPLLQQGTGLSGTRSVKSLRAFKFTAVQIKCVNSVEFVYLILLYNTLNLIPSKRNNLAKTSLNSLIRTGWLILFEQMDYFAIRSTNVNQLYF